MLFQFISRHQPKSIRVLLSKIGINGVDLKSSSRREDLLARHHQIKLKLAAQKAANHDRSH